MNTPRFDLTKIGELPWTEVNHSLEVVDVQDICVGGAIPTIRACHLVELVNHNGSLLHSVEIAWTKQINEPLVFCNDDRQDCGATQALPASSYPTPQTYWKRKRIKRLFCWHPDGIAEDFNLTAIVSDSAESSETEQETLDRFRASCKLIVYGIVSTS